MRKFLIVLTSILAVLAVLFGVNEYLNSKIEITPYTFSSPKLPKSFDNYKIAVISDFHNAPFYDQAIECVKTINPDLTLFLGDMINVNENDYPNTRKLIEAIVPIAPVYMVSGNHEIFNPEWKKRMETEFKTLGVHIIDIDHFYMWKGDETIHIYGMQDPAVHDEELRDADRKDIWGDVAGKEYDAGAFNLLLCHRANYFPRTSRYGYELVLSGHLHGGLWRLPFVGGVMAADHSSFFPEYTEGVHELNGSTMIVSRGCDKDRRRMRFFNPPEILELTLKCE